jgi:cation:H+ antiporter
MDLSWIYGSILLLVGAELLIRSLVRLSKAYPITDFTLGMTLASLAATLPIALFCQKHQIPGLEALDTIFLMNIAQSSLWLGILLFIFPFRVLKEVQWLALPTLILTYLIIFLVLLGGKVSQAEGVYLLLIFALYVFSQLFFAPQKKKMPTKHPIPPLLFTLCGIGLLIWGTLSFSPKALFSLSGISYPFLALALLCLVRKERSLLLGLIIGSCILNLVLTLSTKALAGSILFSQRLLLTAFPFMTFLAVLFWAIVAFRRRHLSRLDGVIFLALYLAHRAYLFFSS